MLTLLTAGAGTSLHAPAATDVQPEAPSPPAVQLVSPGDGDLPSADSIDLQEALAPPGDESSDTVPGTDATDGNQPPSSRGGKRNKQKLSLLGKQVAPGISSRLSWQPAHSIDGLASPTPVLVVNGVGEGPTLCLTAAVHGDEINGIEIVRRVLYNINPRELSGAVIGVPIVNLQGFQRGSRYLPDRRDLNRYFPGSPRGSSASRIAYSFFHEVIEHCEVLVDLHTGSFDRTNLPQLRADLTRDEVVELTKGFGATVVLHSAGSPGTLRRATMEHGIPAITVEAGGPMRLEEDAISHAVKSIRTLLNHLGMVRKTRIWGDPEPVYYKSSWVRADAGGILQSEVTLGERVTSDTVLGTVTNPITNVRSQIRAPFDGRILGMALDQVVMPGYAAYHVGKSASAGEITTPGKDGITEYDSQEFDGDPEEGLSADDESDSNTADDIDSD